MEAAAARGNSIQPFDRFGKSGFTCLEGAVRMKKFSPLAQIIQTACPPAITTLDAPTVTLQHATKHTSQKGMLKHTLYHDEES